jgi:uncharacterized membrane protein YphA (DoxX/SURF4 family)
MRRHSTRHFNRGFIIFLRLAVGWTFLYAGFTQIFVISDWSAAGFLAHTKTFDAVIRACDPALEMGPSSYGL